ncbi:MAG: sulfatase-like hydrolase/transferase [Nitrososphaerota archaeon]|nr:sulfatase-like hydrolase/transferase [Nitrososphaerota archaeon]MDG6990736.1 sulfatase-like hydrolase/transferase [Nitrososphaerota archaeon]
MKFNVVLLVLDTLREDHAGGLARLESMGFRRYEGAISTDNWTAPSHASMFTGLMPSQHGIHRSFNSDNSARRMAELSSSGLRTQETILSEVRGLGYSTVGYSCNPLVSPPFGYEFDDYALFDFNGKSAHEPPYLYDRSSLLRKAAKLLLDRQFGTIRAQLSMKLRRGTGKALGLHPMEKGSKFVIRETVRKKLAPPFFLFANLMEAHEPYNWSDAPSLIQRQYETITGNPAGPPLNWKERYPRHATLAVERGLELLEALGSRLERSLVIVTSDHGQLLGEGGVYGHELTLDDRLLQVPLYVRYPAELPVLKPGRHVSLASVKSLVGYATGGEAPTLGSDIAMAESFGPSSSVLPLAKDERERSALISSFDHRVRVFGPEGSAVYNKTRDAIEELRGSFSPEAARDAASSLPTFTHDFDVPASLGESMGAFAHDDMEVRERLRRLGYE